MFVKIKKSGNSVKVREIQAYDLIHEDNQTAHLSTFNGSSEPTSEELNKLTDEVYVMDRNWDTVDSYRFQYHKNAVDLAGDPLQAVRPCSYWRDGRWTQDFLKSDDGEFYLESEELYVEPESKEIHPRTAWRVIQSPVVAEHAANKTPAEIRCLRKLGLPLEQVVEENWPSWGSRDREEVRKALDLIDVQEYYDLGQEVEVRPGQEEWVPGIIVSDRGELTFVEDSQEDPTKIKLKELCGWHIRPRARA